MYIQGSREMKRLESVHKSPVFVLFSETLSGLATIRAFGHENRFFRICTEHTDNMNRLSCLAGDCSTQLTVMLRQMPLVPMDVQPMVSVQNATEWCIRWRGCGVRSCEECWFDRLVHSYHAHM